jgi:hypothetical protein
MSDGIDNLVVEHLRAIRIDLGEIKADVVEMRERLGTLEANYANISRRMDRVAGDIEQIKRRLDLVEAKGSRVGSKPPSRREAAVGRAVVDVFKARGKADPDPGRQVAQYIGERVRPRPADRAEERRQARAAPRANEPEPAVLRRAEDEVVTTEEAECIGDMAGDQGRDVAADQHRRAGRAKGEGAAHAPAEIPLALRGDRDTLRPEPGAAAGAVRRHREAKLPALVTAEPAHQQPQHRPLEAQRRGVADVARQAPLANAPRGSPHEQHEMAPNHRP